MHIPARRQRVPIMDDSTLEDRTRPAPQAPTLTGGKLRHFVWPALAAHVDRSAVDQSARRTTP
jgi:hypothetical protein